MLHKIAGAAVQIANLVNYNMQSFLTGGNVEKVQKIMVHIGKAE